jgi:hypothetical protein
MRTIDASELSYDDAAALYSLMGYAALGKGEAFEEEFSSNRKIVTFYNDIIMSFWDIRYYDDISPDTLDWDSGPARRRMEAGKVALYLNPEGRVTGRLMKRLINKTQPAGLPIGIIAGSPGIRDDICSLADFTRAGFSLEGQYRNRRHEGKIRIYDTDGLNNFLYTSRNKIMS